jgi:hypothetical protein
LRILPQFRTFAKFGFPDRGRTPPPIASALTTGALVHQPTHDLPVTMDAAATKMHAASGWGGMVAGYMELPAGTDFTPLLKGLPNDLCHCPHWGYVTKGAVHIRYQDGTEEVATAGELFFWPAGHTGWVVEDSAFLEFSPEKENSEVMAHVRRVTSQSAES